MHSNENSCNRLWTAISRRQNLMCVCVCGRKSWKSKNLAVSTNEWKMSHLSLSLSRYSRLFNVCPLPPLFQFWPRTREWAIADDDRTSVRTVILMLMCVCVRFFVHSLMQLVDRRDAVKRVALLLWPSFFPFSDFSWLFYCIIFFLHSFHSLRWIFLTYFQLPYVSLKRQVVFLISSGVVVKSFH